VDRARAELLGDGRAAVRAAIVGDDDLAAQAIALTHHLECFARIGDARRQASRLVETGHDDRDVDVGSTNQYFAHLCHARLPERYAMHDLAIIRESP
jgi:hypothetical protein